MRTYDEPPGYCNQYSYVKSNPLNNDSYLAQACEALPEAKYELERAAKELEELIPGYNIAQIKTKFNSVRFYVDVPLDSHPEKVSIANEVLRDVEMASSILVFGKDHNG